MTEDGKLQRRAFNRCGLPAHNFLLAFLEEKKSRGNFKKVNKFIVFVDLLIGSYSIYSLGKRNVASDVTNTFEFCYEIYVLTQV